MIHCISTWKLKKGASLEEFLKFSREVEQPRVLAMEGIHRWDVYQVVDTLIDNPDYHIVEIIWVDSKEKWFEICDTPEMIENDKTWQTWGDPETVKVSIVEQVERVK